MLGADVAVPELARLVEGELDHLLATRRERDLARRDRLLPAADDEIKRGPHLRELDPEGGERASGDGVGVAEERCEQVLGADVVVVVLDRFVLGQGEDALSALGEAIERSGAPRLRWRLCQRARAPDGAVPERLGGTAASMRRRIVSGSTFSCSQMPMRVEFVESRRAIARCSVPMCEWPL